MRVAVLNPPFKGRFSRTSRSPAVTKAGTLYYPFWLSYAVGILEQEGFEIEFIDAPARGLDLEHVLRRIREIKPRLTVIDTSTPSIYSDIQVAEQIKNVTDDNFTIAVGTHPSALPEATLSLSSKLDAVAMGEYDYTIRDLAIALRDSGDLKQVKGMVYKEDNHVIFNPRRELIENLDALPFVSKVYKKYLTIKNYFFAVSNYPFVMIITGRGCPHRCFFCVYPQTFHSRKYRMRSAENVVDEFEYICKELKIVKEVGIEDDTFTIDRQRVHKICELLIKRNIKIHWYCNVRVGLDFDTMRLMKKAGCRLLTVGFEHANQEILDRMQKGITVEQSKKFVQNAKKAGLLVHGAFMCGFPGENKETLKGMLNFAKKLNTAGAQFYPLFVYPGTEAFAWAKKNGYLATTDYSQWLNEEGGYNCVISLPGLSGKDLISFCNHATREYYFRPGYLLSKLRDTFLHPQDFKKDIIASKTFFRHLIFDK